MFVLITTLYLELQKTVQAESGNVVGPSRLPDCGSTDRINISGGCYPGIYSMLVWSRCSSDVGICINYGRRLQWLFHCSQRHNYHR